jgi:hypothetical protein
MRLSRRPSLRRDRDAQLAATNRVTRRSYRAKVTESEPVPYLQSASLACRLRCLGLAPKQGLHRSPTAAYADLLY